MKFESSKSVIGLVHGGDRAHSEKVASVTQEMKNLNKRICENKIIYTHVYCCHCNNGRYQCVQCSEAGSVV